jgi:uncharacterized protein YwqG
MASRDEVIAAAFSELDRHIRRASIAEIGGFRPSEIPITSYFGGRFVARSEEDWPLDNGQPMIPLLQVRTCELPYRPLALEGIALFTVFIGPRELPIDLPAENGDGWLLRSYSSLDELSALVPPADPQVRPFPIRWRLSETEGPLWDDAWELYDLNEFNILEEAIDLFYDRYQQHLHTKVGGWPSYTQSSIGSDDYVFQIGSEEKPRWMWGDNGNGYFSLKEGKWFLYWDCY